MKIRKCENVTSTNRLRTAHLGKARGKELAGQIGLKMSQIKCRIVLGLANGGDFTTNNLCDKDVFLQTNYEQQLLLQLKPICHQVCPEP